MPRRKPKADLTLHQNLTLHQKLTTANLEAAAAERDRLVQQAQPYKRGQNHIANKG